MQKDEWLYLGHMLDQAKRAIALVEGKSFKDYERDEALRLALTHLLQIIGEAARRVPESVRTAHPRIPWRAITGMRHKIVHEYLNVDEDIVWKTVKGELPQLIAVLEKLMPKNMTEEN